ncbi:hypothetical protein IFR04_011150 [Cadophora malorum]|uniref:Uncharacterized protein n=1 Tax=Cadophora malorum TaxID=108018 RepID=A0A8H7T5V0_9HELO|nr:hypothetical protein IFR04_011150 [Cadophora malorum]
MEFGNVFVNGSLLVDVNYGKSCNGAEDDAILLDHNNGVSSNYMLVEKVVAKGWFDLVCYNVAEE